MELFKKRGKQRVSMGISDSLAFLDVSSVSSPIPNV